MVRRGSCTTIAPTSFTVKPLINRFEHNSAFKDMPDHEVLSLYKATGDKHYVGMLYKRYTHLTLGLCLKYLKDRAKAEDAVMEIFEKLLNDLLKHDVSNFKSWLYTYSKNHCLMKLRKKTREISLDGVENHRPELMEFQREMHPTDEKEVQLQALESAVNELSPEQKQCIELFYLEGKTYAEVAEATGFDMKKVKSYIQNGKRNLMITLSRSGMGKALSVLPVMKLLSLIMNG